MAYTNKWWMSLVHPATYWLTPLPERQALVEKYQAGDTIPESLHSMMSSLASTAHRPITRTLNLTNQSVWLSSAFSHKFSRANIRRIKRRRKSDLVLLKMRMKVKWQSSRKLNLGSLSEMSSCASGQELRNAGTQSQMTRTSFPMLRRLTQCHLRRRKRLKVRVEKRKKKKSNLVKSTRTWSLFTSVYPSSSGSPIRKYS